MSKPITPAEVGAAKAVHIPAAVFEAFNVEIARRYSHGSAQVLQKDVVRRLTEGGMSRTEIFDSGWLNVEAAYETAGWKVEYDKPGYNESGEAVFKFIG
jgi:hypothetical protein